MSSKSTVLLTGVLLALLAAAAEAAPPARSPSARPNPRSEISPGEAARIRYQVHQHQQMQHRAAADGEVSRHEHAVLARDAAQVRHLIHIAGTN